MRGGGEAAARCLKSLELKGDPTGERDELQVRSATVEGVAQARWRMQGGRQRRLWSAHLRY